jgi:hypothetical protein
VFDLSSSRLETLRTHYLATSYKPGTFTSECVDEFIDYWSGCRFRIARPLSLIFTWMKHWKLVQVINVIPVTTIFVWRQSLKITYRY